MDSYIYIDGWQSDIRFSSAHIIPDYEKCGRLHGHTYAVHVKIVGNPDEKGIIMDFALLKDIFKKIVNELDHRILIPEKSSLVTIKREEKSINMVTLKKHYVLPMEDCIFLPIDSTSAENLAHYILNRALEKITVSKRIKSVEVGVDEGLGQGARVTKILKG
jgi:6-pyruvoyltetrahydropterin/6-carboxytetrahydropterin synthase